MNIHSGIANILIKRQYGGFVFHVLKYKNYSIDNFFEKYIKTSSYIFILLTFNL